jgi:hypothetical protein
MNKEEVLGKTSKNNKIYTFHRQISREFELKRT